MKFAELVDFYDRLAATPRRLEMRKILTELLDRVDSGSASKVLYLTQGMLRPEYEGVELGVADSLARRSLETAGGLTPEAVSRSLRETGDLGSTAEALLSPQAKLPSDGVTAAEVYDAMLEVARSGGEGSQERKTKLLVDLLSRASPKEAKYLLRFVLGRLRLGVRELTILDALAQKHAGGTKDGRERIEAAYNLCSDLGRVEDLLSKKGLDGLSELRLEVGRPIRPMLAERAKDLSDLLERMDGKAAVEIKYDGLRIQAHVFPGGDVKLFSRRLEELSTQFPELCEELPKAYPRRPAIVEGECVAVDLQTDEIRPFQEISRRRGRKYELERIRSEIPVNFFVFDQLLDGTDELLPRPFPERRERLEKRTRPNETIRLARQEVVSSVPEAQKFFDAAVAIGGEGIVAKSLSPDSAYRAGARGFWWIKYKRDYTDGLADTIDGVAVGAFFGRGRRAGRYGAILLATFNDELDRFETFCRVGSGFDDELLEKLPRLLKPLELDTKPASVEARLEPDRWLDPKLVMTVKGAELTLSPIHPAALGKVREGAGLALRFPRFTGVFREDKGPTDATTSKELLRLFKLQTRRSSKEGAESDPSR